MLPLHTCTQTGGFIILFGMFVYMANIIHFTLRTYSMYKGLFDFVKMYPVAP